MNPWSDPLVLEPILLQSMPMAYPSSLMQIIYSFRSGPQYLRELWTIQWRGATMNPWSDPLVLEPILLQSMPMTHPSSLMQIIYKSRSGPQHLRELWTKQGDLANQHQSPCHPVYHQWRGVTLNLRSVPLILEPILLQSMPMTHPSSLM